MKFVSMFTIALSLAIAANSFGEAPYISQGFLEFPAECKLDAVSAVAIDAKDNIYVLQRGTPPVMAFDAKGKYQRGWGEGMFKVPHGLRIDKDSNIWTTDNGNHVLRKFSPDGKLLATLGTEGKAAGSKEGFRSPDDLVFDTAGNIYVADAGNARVVKLSAEGTYLSQFGSKGKGPGQFATAHSLAIDRENHIYVGDRGNKRVQRFDSKGQHLADWTGFGNAFGVLVVGNELLASEGDIHKIYHINMDGKIVNEWGNPDELKLPHLMATDSQGKLYIAEVNGKRVQIFKKR